MEKERTNKYSKIYAFYGLGKTYLTKQNENYFDYDKFYKLNKNEIPNNKIILTNDINEDVDLVILPKDPFSRLSDEKKLFFEQYPNLLITEYANAKKKTNVIILEDDEYLTTYLNNTNNKIEV